MAENMAAVLPWRARTLQSRYLSFLPMNHVVEGILATYSSYYLPASVDIYFLEEFRALPTALPRVRPTVFFSVPRVYERVWESFAASRIGRWYLAAPRGLLKSLLRRVARRGVLGRAGLDRALQLIAGSAAVSQHLLRSFRDLGVEIHNAYGLTEAPLVTLNRVGSNHLGTVGQPLPRTEIAIAADGEVLVRGPQVTSGYAGHAVDQPLADGWLQTGDLGHLNSAGDLVIEGRKKEIIATSYGKKVQIARMEELLRQIPDVTEAMVIGEARPFCTALLWTDLEPMPLPAIERGVEGANAQLSHAEQVKRWAVLPNDLSIERGDLTPNLKLKRAAVAQRLERVIEGLYGEARAA
jgi:long-chain acyl-CoA synthetase